VAGETIFVPARSHRETKQRYVWDLEHGVANGHTRRSDILDLPWRNDRGNCRPRFGARGIGVDLGHVHTRPFVPRKLPRPLMQTVPREQSLAKQFRTETQLLDLVRAHIERFHRGPLLDGAQFIKVIRVANDPNRNWRVAYGGVTEDYAVALDEAEAERTELYHLSS
jgi:hypothetical protein